MNGAAEGPPHFAFAVVAAFAVAFAFTRAFAFAFAFPVVIPGEPALSEVEWGDLHLFVAFAFFSSFLAQKSHVKPKNPPINPTKKPQTKQDQPPARQKINPPKLKFSFTQFDTIKE